MNEQGPTSGGRNGGSNLRHLVLLGSTAGRTQRTSRNKRYRVPDSVVEYIGQLTAMPNMISKKQKTKEYDTANDNPAAPPVLSLSLSLSTVAAAVDE